MRRFRSILSRVVALHVVAIGVTSILIPLALYWLLNEAANGLHRDALRAQALTIASFLRPTPDGGVTLEIPQEAQPIYSGDYALYAYAILDSKGKLLFTSRPDEAPLSAGNDSLTKDSFMQRRSKGPALIGVNVPRAIGDRLYWIQ
ncbi:MAG: sensor histidine kinase N-terminal domain-containing protein, partial [Reyranella sp.]|nr:sensor histidine kinase N-terminal domain-containing protein [Reyranella sp.]